MNLKTLAAGLAIGLASVAGIAATSTTADAKGGHHSGGHHSHGHGHGHGHHHFRHRHFAVPYVVTTGNGCGVYWRRYEATGNSYWKRRYYECID